MAADLSELRTRLAALQREADRLEREFAAEPWYIGWWPALSGPAWRRRRRWAALGRELADLGAAIDAASAAATPPPRT